MVVEPALMPLLAVASWALFGGAIGAHIAQKRGTPTLSYVLGGMLLGPLSLAMFLTMPDQRTERRQCPFCAEWIMSAAVVCRHCGRDLNSSTAQGVEGSESAILKKRTTSAGPLMAVLALAFLLVVAWFAVRDQPITRTGEQVDSVRPAFDYGEIQGHKLTVYPRDADCLLVRFDPPFEVTDIGVVDSVRLIARKQYSTDLGVETVEDGQLRFSTRVGSVFVSLIVANPSGLAGMVIAKGSRVPAEVISAAYLDVRLPERSIGVQKQ